MAMLRQLTFKVSDTCDLQTWLQSSNRFDLVDVFSHESKPLILLLSLEEKVQASVAFFLLLPSLLLFSGGGGGGFLLGGDYTENLAFQKCIYTQ